MDSQGELPTLHPNVVTSPGTALQGHEALKTSHTWWKKPSQILQKKQLIEKLSKGYDTNFPRAVIQSNDLALDSGFANGALNNQTNITYIVAPSEEAVTACRLLTKCLQLRTKYEAENPCVDRMFTLGTFDPIMPASQHTMKTINGVIHAFEGDADVTPVISVEDYYQDYKFVVETDNTGPVKTFSYFRLKSLEFKFDFHILLNDAREQIASQWDPKDFESVIKVDTHIHLSAAMTSKHLLEFIKKTVKERPDDIVNVTKDGKKETLKDLFDRLNINPEYFTLDSLETRAGDTFQRFDKFNMKYNPFGKGELRDVFLKTANVIEGKYYADITKECLKKMEKSKYQMAEYRVSIYGRKASEWDELAKWVVNNDLFSAHNRWVIQFPRIFFVLKKVGLKHFQELLENMFLPLFEVTRDPSSHPDLHKFLTHVCAFDSVDDESRAERKFDENTAKLYPENWTTEENPPYAYYNYYFWANITALNKFRRIRGMKPFDFRPHCGESGDLDHLASSFLVAKHINHGINLAKTPVLQYLYYLKQIGLAVSPLSNHQLFLQYKDNPFARFFKKGLNVSLSTDDPLQFHYTEDPLLEEYAIAAQRWKLGVCDLSEIARNSVLQSSFEHSEKMRWIGPNYKQEGSDGNDIRFTNLPNIRICYRYETLQAELNLLKRFSTSGQMSPRDISVSMETTEALGKIVVKSPHPSAVTDEEELGARRLTAALELRRKYKQAIITKTKAEGPGFTSGYTFRSQGGVYYVRECITVGERTFVDPTALIVLPKYNEFLHDYNKIVEICHCGPTATMSHIRMRLMEYRFEFHTLLNGSRESDAMKNLKLDYYHMYKVDNNVRLHTGMIAKHLLKFIKTKIRNHPNDVVYMHGDHPVTLQKVFDGMGITLENLTLDSLDVRAEGTFQRYDTLEMKTNPFGVGELQTLFLKYDNFSKGKYFGELARELLRKKKKTPYHLFEYRLPFLGRHRREWDELADWIITNGLESSQINWVIEIPRGYKALKVNGSVHSFQEQLDNIFAPLFEVTQDPSTHPALARIMNKISAISMIPHELNHSSAHRTIISGSVLPRDWINDDNPSVAYTMYYFWANLQSLNSFRKNLGLSTIKFVPQSGLSLEVSSGIPIDVMISFLLADEISQGIDLAKSSTLQYLYYLAQIGIFISPLSVNNLVMDYEKNPFEKFYKRGLAVTLATENPLQIHITNDPVAEEYAIAAQMWKFSTCDLAEIARNSVLHSGFDKEVKIHLLGKHYEKEGVEGNDPSKTSLPNIRVNFRSETWRQEHEFLHSVVNHKSVEYQ